MQQDQVERVCELLYEAAAVSDVWPKALAALAEATDAVNAHIVFWNSRENQSGFFASARPDRGWETLYHDYYGAIAPCRHLLDDRRVGEWIASQRYFDRAFVRRSEYFNDFLLKIGGLYSVKGRVFETPSRSTYAITGVLRSPKAGPLEEDAVEGLAVRLNEHLRRAAALHYKLTAARPQGRLLEAALDRLSSGVVVVNASGQILAANRTAQGILEARDGLLERTGALHAGGRDDDERLRHCLAGAAAPCRKHPWTGGCLRIARPSGKPAYLMTITPLAESIDLPSMGGDRAAMILISDPDREKPADLPRALRTAYGLTPAEARTASLVGQGLAPQEVADQLGISVGTVRCELKSIYAKLDISRQSELAATMARLSLIIPEENRDEDAIRVLAATSPAHVMAKHPRRH